MRMFVAFGFNDRDKWIKELVFPIIQAFGDEVVDGQELPGQKISDVVEERIRRSNALIGFLTRREAIGGGKWTTHRWVLDELATAVTNKIPVVEVRELGVDDQGGKMGDRQRIIYDPEKQEILLVDLVKTLGEWHQTRNVRFQLLPPEYAVEIFRHYRKAECRCTYRVMIDDEERPEEPTRILPIKGGLFVEVKNVPARGLVQIQVDYAGTTWISAYESVDAIGVNLMKG